MIAHREYFRRNAYVAASFRARTTTDAQNELMRQTTRISYTILPENNTYHWKCLFNISINVSFIFYVCISDIIHRHAHIRFVNLRMISWNSYLANDKCQPLTKRTSGKVRKKHIEVNSSCYKTRYWTYKLHAKRNGVRKTNICTRPLPKTSPSVHTQKRLFCTTHINIDVVTQIDRGGSRIYFWGEK